RHPRWGVAARRAAGTWSRRRPGRRRRRPGRSPARGCGRAARGSPTRGPTPIRARRRSSGWPPCRPTLPAPAAGLRCPTGSLAAVSLQEIRIIGDPVLQQKAKPVDDIDGGIARLVETMFDAMYAAPGLGLAAPQIGVRKRIFVYDIDDDPQVLINPEIVESSGEWAYEEGCLSVPGLAWEIVRPDEVHLRGLGLDGNQVDIEADELLGRVFQHELDHLDGVLLVEHLTDEQRAEARQALRDL